MKKFKKNYLLIILKKDKNVIICLQKLFNKRPWIDLFIFYFFPNINKGPQNK